MITFSPKYTAINAGLSVAGALTYAFSLPHTTYNEFAIEMSSFIFSLIGLPSILALLLTLTATFSNKCNCCRSCCCFSCCTEPFEIGALLTSSPHTPYVLRSDGQLRKVETGGGL